MFYKMIKKRRDIWLSASSCPVHYITQPARRRDAQAEARKTSLLLKAAGENRPLYELFAGGRFNSLDLDEIELTPSATEFLRNRPAAAALFEYASAPAADGQPFVPNVLRAVKSSPDGIGYGRFFRTMVYNASYPDYLFRLPVGAGKTYLTAAFIYFAGNEPDNPAFAHNFMIMVSSGLKPSVIPSPGAIQNFNPAWVIPEPAAANLKRKLVFAVLDQNKPGQNSNKTRNPNVEEISVRQPLKELFGFAAAADGEMENEAVIETAARKTSVERITIDAESREEGKGIAGYRQWLAAIANLSCKRLKNNEKTPIWSGLLS